jgi:hypothetical protein
VSRVHSISTSAHKYGLVYPGLGWVVWRSAEYLPENLIFKVGYLGGSLPTFALNFSRPGGRCSRFRMTLPGTSPTRSRRWRRSRSWANGSDIADSVRYLEGLDRPLPREGRKTGAFHH